MGKLFRSIMLIVILMSATLACQLFQTAPPQGSSPTAGTTAAPPTTAPMILPTIIQATATNEPPVFPTEPGQVFIDDFSNRDSGWTYEYSDTVDWDYYMGGYRVSVRTSGTRAWNVLVDHEYENVRLVVDARKIGGQEENLYGLLCRHVYASKSFYAAVISSTGSYAIIRQLNGENPEVISKEIGQSVVINQGLTINLVEMSCVGNRIGLTVNGVLLSEAFDSSIQTGTVGMYVSTDFTESNDILFDNFHLYLEE